MSTALYRRYRPDTFAQVIGQEHVTEPLRAALRAGRINHAYLFSGPRGCGKTTSARIMARCLNCAEGPTDVPCGTCESCVELATGAAGSLDVVEIDAASHNGVEDARELRERAAFAPVRDRYKIFILDEAHMVTPAGFNALLKLVEEPPEHVLFIFATTEPEKVIGTIRSRTHHYPFRLVAPDTMATYLEQLCAEEQVRLDDGVAGLIVRAGGGSVRDSLSVLDQLIAGSDQQTVSYPLALALLGYTDQAILLDAVDALATRDARALFGLIERSIATGHDPRRFVEDLLQRLRDLVVLSLAGEDARAALMSVPDDQFAHMLDQARLMGPVALTRAADLANQALSAMVGATSPRLHLEILAAKLLLPASPAPAARAAEPQGTGADGGSEGGRGAGSASAGREELAVGSAAEVREYLAQRRAARAAAQQTQKPAPADAGPVAWSADRQEGVAEKATPSGAGPVTWQEAEWTESARTKQGAGTPPDVAAATTAPPVGEAREDAPAGAGPATVTSVEAAAAATNPQASTAAAEDTVAGDEVAAAHGAGSPVGTPTADEAVTLDVPQARQPEADHEPLLGDGMAGGEGVPEPEVTGREATEPASSTGGDEPPHSDDQPTPASGERPEREAVGVDAAPELEVTEPEMAEPTSSPERPSNSGATSTNVVRERWGEVLAALAAINHVTHARLTSTATLGPVGDRSLTLLFNSEGAARQFAQGPYLERVRQAVVSALGLDLEVIARHGEAPATPPPDQPSPAAAPAAAEPAPAQVVAWPDPVLPPDVAPSRPAQRPQQAPRTPVDAATGWPQPVEIPDDPAPAPAPSAVTPHPSARTAPPARPQLETPPVTARRGLYAVPDPAADAPAPADDADEWILDEADLPEQPSDQHTPAESEEDIDLTDTVPLEDAAPEVSGVAALTEVLGGTVIDETPLTFGGDTPPHA